MRVAAIDVGTNSIHLLVTEVDSSGNISIVEKAREQVELGKGGLSKNRIADDAFARGLKAMGEFKEALDGLEVDAITSAATSAVREACNGSDFVRAVREKTGIHIRVISGLDEAELIYKGARVDLDFAKGYALLLDLGGGSAEFILADASGPLFSESLPLGHIRLTDSFAGKDFAKEGLTKLRSHVRHSLVPIQSSVHAGSFGTLVGTSGAIRTLARMATLARGDSAPMHDHGLVMSKQEVEDLVELLAHTPSNKISDLPGMDSRRRRTLPSAAAFLAETMSVLGAESVVTSERGLRDGLIREWIEQNEPQIALSRRILWPRMRAVMHLIERFAVNEQHANKVRDLCMPLFDTLAETAGLKAEDRRMLEYGALLHDVGHHIDGASHNKHGQYLILHTRMGGFTAPEQAFLGNLVRYHRGGRPKQSHVAFAALSPQDQMSLSALAGILRIADALDRSHNQPVTSLKITDGNALVTINVRTKGPAHLERWSVERRKALLEAVLKKQIRFVFKHEKPRSSTLQNGELAADGIDG